MFSTIIRSQDNNIFLSTKVIIEKNVAEKKTFELFREDYKKYHNKIPLHNVKTVKANWDTDELPEGGLHYPYRPFI